MIEIKNDKFFVLETQKGKWLFGTEEEAVDKLRNQAKQTDPEETRIVEININGEEWSIKQVPWSKIAMQLIGD